MKELVLLLFTISPLVIGKDWSILLPPDAQRTTFLGIVPYYSKQDPSLIVGFGTGELLEITLTSGEIVPLHVNNNLQASLLSTPTSYKDVLNAFTVIGPVKTIVTHAQDGNLWYSGLNDDPNARTWNKHGVTTATVQARFMIPMSNQHSGDVIVVYDNSLAYIHNVYSISYSALGTFTGRPTSALYTDMMIEDSSSNVYLTDVLLVGGDTGYVTLFSELAGTTVVSSLGVGGGKVVQILHYKTSQKNQYVIFNTMDVTTPSANNRLLFVDLATPGRASRQFSTAANNMTIFSDSLMTDWLIFSNSTGVYKFNLNTFNMTTSPFIPIQISVGFGMFTTTNNPIISLQTNVLSLTDNTGEEKDIPCVVAVSSQGFISVLRGDDFTWQEIGTPLELASIANTIVAAQIIQTSDVLSDSIFTLVAVLDDGAIVSRDLPQESFTTGVHDNSEERYRVEQNAGAINLTMPAYETGALSLIQLEALVEENKPIILLFETPAGDTVQYRLLGFQEETNIRREDSPKLTLQLAQTITNAAVLKKHNLGFFPALLGAFDVAYDACLFGADLWGKGQQLVYTGTQIFDAFGGLFLM